MRKLDLGTDREHVQRTIDLVPDDGRLEPCVYGSDDGRCLEDPHVRAADADCSTSSRLRMSSRGPI